MSISLIDTIIVKVLRKILLFCIIRNKIYLETHQLQNYRKYIRICQLATHDMSIVLYIHPISTHYLRRERIWEMIIRWCWNGMSKVISLIYIRYQSKWFFVKKSLIFSKMILCQFLPRFCRELASNVDFYRALVAKFGSNE